VSIAVLTLYHIVKDEKKFAAENRLDLRSETKIRLLGGRFNGIFTEVMPS